MSHFTIFSNFSDILIYKGFWYFDTQVTIHGSSFSAIKIAGVSLCFFTGGWQHCNKVANKTLCLCVIHLKSRQTLKNIKALKSMMFQTYFNVPS